DAFTNSEAFLGAVSSCGVTLIEMHAKETGVPLQSMTVTIEGRRPPTLPRFSSALMTFEMTGVSQPQAQALVETYRARRPTDGTVAVATEVKVKVVARPQ